MPSLTRIIGEFGGEVVGGVEVLQHPRSSGGHVDADLGLVAVGVDEARDGAIVVKDAQSMKLIVLHRLQLTVVSVDRVLELEQLRACGEKEEVDGNGFRCD